MPAHERRRFEYVTERMRQQATGFDPEYIVFARKLALLGLSRREARQRTGWCSTAPRCSSVWHRSAGLRFDG